MGERFGHYEIMRRLAAGGMAEVLLAKQTSLGGFERLVCLKRILAHLSGQEEFLRMFQDEARIAANLVHPNVAQIYDIDVVDGQFYIAMEYVRGEDLRRVYNQEVSAGHAIPKHVAALVAMGAAAGLDYAHRQSKLDGTALGIVHRDVSPQNILVTYDGHVKLIDFGVAKAAGKLNQTRAGVLKGKYSYMSPEQASGDPVDGRTDIFALGVTLYEITTGTRLFKRDNELETLHAVIACNVRPPSEVVPAYDGDLEAIVLRALAYDVDSRYSTAGEMEHDLERYLLRRGYPTSASSLAGYMQDLFADKLADEALFSGPPWTDPAGAQNDAVPHSAQGPRQQQDAVTVADGGGQGMGSGAEATSVDPVTANGSDADAQGQVRVASEPAAAAPAPLTAVTGTPAEWREALLDGEASIATAGDGADVAHREQVQEAPTQPMSPLMPEAAVAEAVVDGGRRRGRRPWLVAASILVLATAAGLVMRQRLVRPAAKTRVVEVQAEAPKQTPASLAPGEPTRPAAAEAAPPARPTLDVAHEGWVDFDAPVPMAVTLGGRYLGETPLRQVVLPAGVLRVRFENRRDGGVVPKTVRLAAGGQTQVTLADAVAPLDVCATPWAWVQLGMHPAVQTPMRLTLLPGEYTVTLECPDGRRRTDVVQVALDAGANVRIDCTRR